ncbi:hypothetical protein Poly51_15470 [Rubripirellula tenax]|uniref:Uncharacterized protein n=1 Tax=Rubripirellula tenax TaxID=2528015 RepID=A0A5C6FDM5_9BACT|nr:hypothetical protein [Rubripirellula tenax]TWU58767.1 hypothetical protein Poly51_15470 [Rubripirellula tenax]
MYRVGPLLHRFLLTGAMMGSVLTSLSLPSVALAQWSASDRERLASQIDSASKHLDSSRFPSFDESRGTALNSLNAAESFFTRQTDASNAAAWLDYLDLGPLRDAITADESETDVARRAIDLRYRLVGTSPGLELSRLTTLRRDLERLIEAVRLRDPQRAETLVARQMEALAEKIREMGDHPSAEDVSSLNAVVGLLIASEQAGDFVAALGNQFNRPNLAVLVSESMVQSAINRGVNQSRPVRDCILGTRIVGSASLNGMITADVLPSIGDVRVQVALAGCVTNKNTGYNGPVVLRTSGVGSVNVSRMLHISEAGIRADNAFVQASLSTNIDAIEHRMRLVRRIASKKAAEQKPKADRIAVEKLRTQVGSQFVEQTDTATAVAPPDVLANVRPVLTRMSLDEPARLWGSTDQMIFIDATLRRTDQLASVTTRPLITQAFDAAVQIHESAIDNAMTPLLAGRTLREGDFEEIIADAGLPVQASKTADTGRSVLESSTDDDSGEEDDETPFEIDFARLRPIIFEARDQTIRVGVRGTRFATGTRELKQAMEITAVYEPARTQDGRMLLLRKDTVDVSFPGPSKRLTMSQAGLKRTIQKKFAEVFPEVLLDQSFTVPMTSKLESLRGRVFRPESVDAQNGWLSVGVAAVN